MPDEWPPRRARFDLAGLSSPSAGRIRAIRRRVNAAILLRVAALLASAAFMGVGALFVTHKAMALATPFESRVPLAVALVTVPVAYALMRGIGRVPRPFTDREAAVLYDVATGGGGLSLTLAERGRPAPADWGPRLGEADALAARAGPPIRLRALRILRPAALPAAFLAGAIFVPGRPPVDTRPDVALRRAVRETLAAAEALTEAAVLEEEDLASLRQELERIEEREKEAETSAWEAVDAIDERIASRVQSAADALAWAMEAADTLMESPGDGALREELEAAIERLARSGALRELAQQFGGGAGGALSLPDDPAALERALRQLESAMGDAAGKLCKSAAGCRGSSARQALEDLKEFCNQRMKSTPGMGDLYLAEGDGEGETATGTDGRQPGTGGISRGRADAPMLWGKQTAEAGATFTSHELPPGAVDVDHSTLVGVRFATPEVTGERAGGPSGLEAAAGVGEAGSDARLSPARREIVRKYFSTRTGPSPRAEGSGP